MSNHAREALRTAWQMGLALLIATLLLTMGLTANQAGWFGPPTDEGTQATSQFEVAVAADGRATVEGMQAFSEEVREEVLGTVYSSPDAFMQAVEGEPVGNPAWAHAINVCWKANYDKVVYDTGTSRHRTHWRKDYNGFRYTTTFHEVLSGGYWVKTAAYKWRIDKRYCS